MSVALFLCLPNPLIGLAALAALLLIDYGAHRIGSLRKTRYQVATLNEILAQADIVEFYKDQTAADKDIGELGGPQGDAPYNLVHAVRAERIKWFVQRFRLQGRRVLDIGCGRGNNTLHFLDSDNTAVGMDLQPSLIADFRSRTESPAVMGDACCLPFRDQCFDVVCFSEVIEHLQDPESALAEIGRVLRPDGYVLLTTENRNAVLLEQMPNPFIVLEKVLGLLFPRVLPFRELLYEGYGDRFYHTSFARPELCGLAKGAGLRPVLLTTYAYFSGIELFAHALIPSLDELKAARVYSRIDRLLNLIPIMRYLGNNWVLVAQPKK